MRCHLVKFKRLRIILTIMSEKEKTIRKSIQGKGEADYDFKHDTPYSLKLKTENMPNQLSY